MTALIPSLVFAWLFLWLRPTPEAKVLGPLWAFYLSTAFHALVNGPGPLGAIAPLLAIAALTFMLVEIGKQLLRAGNTEARRVLPRSLLVAALVFLAVCLAADALGPASRGTSLPPSANPRGLPAMAVAVVYWLGVDFAALRREPLERSLAASAAAMAIGLGMLVGLTAVGVLAGNTEKAAAGSGGIGLANYSTNETASLGAALLLWCVWARQNAGPVVRHAATVGIVACLCAILGARSRVGIAVAGVVLFAGVLDYRTVRRQVGRLLVVLLVAFLVAGAVVISQRSTSETYKLFQKELRGADVAGGTRLLVWASYGTAFLDYATARPVVWLVGVGPSGLPSLYDISPLEDLGIAVKGERFYPVHSDVLSVFLTTGALGVAAMVLLAVGVLRLPMPRQRRVFGIVALVAFLFTVAADMLQFIPIVYSLLFLMVSGSLAFGPQVAVRFDGDS